MNYASSHGEGIAYRTLTAEQIHDIHSASCRILEEVGVIVHHDEAAELLKKWGAYIDADGRTHIPEAMVKRALHTAPSRITVYNRLSEPVIWLENPMSTSERALIPSSTWIPLQVREGPGLARM